jgi:integrase
MARNAKGQAPTYQAQKITVELIRKAAAWAPPEKPREILDSAAGLILRHQPSGFLGLYVALGRGKRERPFGKQCDARRVVDANSVLTLGAVKAEAKRLRGEDAGGRDFKAERSAQRSVPTLTSYLEDTFGPWVNENRRSGAATLARLEACFVDDFGNDKLTELTPAALEPWRSRRRREGVANETINRDIDALRGALTRAVKLEIIESNPLAGVERAEVDRHKRVVRAVTSAEKPKLLAELASRDDKKREERASANKWRKQRGYESLPPLGRYADALTPAVIMSLETGLRRNELFSLQWPAVDFDEKTVRVRGTTAKTYETRDIPLNDVAYKTLRDWWLQCGQPKSGLVFTLGGEKIGNLKRSYHAVLSAAGIKRVNAKGERVNWHSLRHTFGSLLGAANVDPVTLMKLMGHANLETTQRYLHSDFERKRAAVELLHG